MVNLIELEIKLHNQTRLRVDISGEEGKERESGKGRKGGGKERERERVRERERERERKRERERENTVVHECFNISFLENLLHISCHNCIIIINFTNENFSIYGTYTRHHKRPNHTVKTIQTAHTYSVVRGPAAKAGGLGSIPAAMLFLLFFFFSLPAGLLM